MARATGSIARACERDPASGHRTRMIIPFVDLPISAATASSGRAELLAHGRHRPVPVLLEAEADDLARAPPSAERCPEPRHVGGGVEATWLRPNQVSRHEQDHERGGSATEVPERECLELQLSE